MRNSRMLLSLALLGFLTAQLATGQQSSRPDLTGSWAFSIGHRTLIVLSLHEEKKGDHPYSGSLSRPRHMQTADSATYSQISGGTIVEAITASSWKDAALSFTVQNPANAKDTDDYLLTWKDDSHAELQYDGIPLPPVLLAKASGLPVVAGDWDSSKTYSPDDDFPSNAEMKKIFEEDQKVRQSNNVDWAAADRLDAENRQATRKLLEQDALHTGYDFFWAAFIFQHGSEPDDYLLAHTLAMIAIRKGNGNALWIATATLDRYLQSIHQPQIYGTQFLMSKDHPTTQDPYNRKLIADVLRRKLGVPTLAAQEKQREQYDRENQFSK